MTTVLRAMREELQKISEDLYHGSHRKLTVLTPRNEHGDPDVKAAIFASPSKPFALAYSGKKWGDRDIEQSVRGGKTTAPRMTLREMRPGALETTYNTHGYLYHLPPEPFKGLKGRRTSKEVISEEPVKPLKMDKIKNVLTALKAESSVELYPYDPDHPANRIAIRRQVKRMREMSPEDAKGYRRWRLGMAPPEVKSMFREEEQK